MDLEHLTKHQVILLTLLVSLVTSISTGIVTVSLMNHAPQGVTRTINQIVEHTVQTVVPAPQGAAAATTVTTEKTIVVKDDDLTAKSIGSVQKAIVRLTKRGGDELIARGVIVDSKGTALTDTQALLASGAKEFDAILSDGTRVPVAVTSLAASTSLATVTVNFGTSTAAAPALLADKSKLQLGQSIIRIGGKGTDVVGVGVIAALPGTSGMVEASVTSSTPGSVLVNIFGEIIGLATSDSLGEGSDYYTIAAIPAASATKPPPKT